MTTFTFDLVTPEKLLLKAEADMVEVPGAEGDFGVLAGHAPIIASLRPGVVTVENNGATRRFYVSGGVAEVLPDRCTLLAEDALDIDATDASALETRIADLTHRAAENMGGNLHLDHQRNILNEILAGKR